MSWWRTWVSGGDGCSDDRLGLMIVNIVVVEGERLDVKVLEDGGR